MKVAVLFVHGFSNVLVREQRPGICDAMLCGATGENALLSFCFVLYPYSVL